MEQNFTIQIPDDAKEMMRILRDSGYESYVVGGCVRDMIVGKQPNDYDICTNALPDQMKTIFSSSKHNTYDTGLQHGTISVLGKKDKQVYEITTYRVDGEYTDGRHPDGVHFVSNVEQDLARRDFTINAMCYNEDSGLVDPFGGVQDLKNGLIRCVGNPDKRFQEDGLRIMRAIRFASTYGFEIEQATKDAIHANKHLLKNISAERKTVEFVRMLTTANANLLMEYSDVFAEFIPEIKPMIGFNQKSPWHKYDVYEHTARAVEIAPNDATIRLAVFFHDIGKPQTFQECMGRGHFRGHADAGKKIVEKVMKNMKFDTASIKDVSLLVQRHDDPLTHNIEPHNIKWLLNSIGEENLRRLVKIQLSDQQAQRGTKHELTTIPVSDRSFEDNQIISQLSILDRFDDAITDVIKSGDPYRIKDLAVNGNDLIANGFKPGKDIGDTLNFLLSKAIEHPEINNKESLLKLSENILNMLTERDELEHNCSEFIDR